MALPENDRAAANRPSCRRPVASSCTSMVSASMETNMMPRKTPSPARTVSLAMRMTSSRLEPLGGHQVQQAQAGHAHAVDDQEREGDQQHGLLVEQPADEAQRGEGGDRADDAEAEPLQLRRRSGPRSRSHVDAERAGRAGRPPANNSAPKNRMRKSRLPKVRRRCRARPAGSEARRRLHRLQQIRDLAAGELGGDAGSAATDRQRRRPGRRGRSRPDCSWPTGWSRVLGKMKR